MGEQRLLTFSCKPKPTALVYACAALFIWKAPLAVWPCWQACKPA
jgi:hypothetical protein